MIPDKGVFTRNEIQPVILTDKKMVCMATNGDVLTATVLVHLVDWIGDGPICTKILFSITK